MSGTNGVRGRHIRVLIVDDEPALTELSCVAVTEAGRRPHPAADGESAPRTARSRAPHGVVLGGTLPDLDGLQVQRTPRYGSPGLPVPTLTARDARVHRLDGPEAGADGHATEPFSPEEVDGAPVRLTAKEFDLRSPLMGHPRQVLGKGRILEHVWTTCFDSADEFVEVYGSGPRRGIDRGRAPMTHTPRGLGCAIRPGEDGR
ncbi:response regulator transcription factor [Streptomyces sp. WI04-05B]|uniref:response regulator transcription factor n=1 Tax=Streptomyces TaxID=1883 RepID=UPI0029BE8A14|nr:MULTISPECIES: response regulator transcription factor [unclassified Streptomyces]MDX2546505.1 response regulator transcription factor [Streptomyces sp. WI04-05B]MDX2587863.1 response regulator transcription factor [Streptomyces sp. WI04-05A]